MPISQENAQSLKRSTPPPSLPRPPVFPPLPPLPPPDASKWIKPTRKAPSLTSVSVTGTRSESRPRRFGTKITNLLSAGDGSSPTHKTDHKSPGAIALAAAQRYYHQCQNYSHPGKKPPVSEKMGGENYEIEADNLSKESPTTLSEDTSNKSDLRVSERSPKPSKVQDCIPNETPKPGRTIWSVTPDELTELAKEMTVMKKESAEPAMKLSYAEASKRNLPGFTESPASQEVKAVEAEQPLRTFKKYYGLPIIPSYEASRRDIHYAATLEEKEDPFEDDTNPSKDNESSSVLNHSQISGLSASTPTFYPRQTTETNDLIQLLKASLASKKVAPHMDWWPGDWKCTNCGTHASDVELGDWKTLVSCSRQLLLIAQPEFPDGNKYYVHSFLENGFEVSVRSLEKLTDFMIASHKNVMAEFPRMNIKISSYDRTLDLVFSAL